MSTIETTAYTDAEVVSAIRLALAGTESAKDLVPVIQKLIDEAPESDGTDTRSVRLFVETVRAIGGEFVVNDG